MVLWLVSSCLTMFHLHCWFHICHPPSSHVVSSSEKNHWQNLRLSYYLQTLYIALLMAGFFQPTVAHNKCASKCIIDKDRRAPRGSQGFWSIEGVELTLISLLGSLSGCCYAIERKANLKGVMLLWTARTKRWRENYKTKPPSAEPPQSASYFVALRATGGQRFATMSEASP